MSGKVYSGGDVMTVIFSVMMASFALGQLAPIMSTFLEGRIAAANIYKVIDEDAVIEPKLDVMEGGRKKRLIIAAHNLMSH